MTIVQTMVLIAIFATSKREHMGHGGPMHGK
jgi:hypothetical protein